VVVFRFKIFGFGFFCCVVLAYGRFFVLNNLFLICCFHALHFLCVLGEEGEGSVFVVEE